jgi:hypothetical protein
MKQPSGSPWIRLLLVCLGLFGAAFALTGLLTVLPLPAAGGTCGPGQGSETAIVAFFDPVTIGAGREPPATNATARTQWEAFVHECQTAANDRAVVTLPVLLLSAVLVFVGTVVLRRRSPFLAGSLPETSVNSGTPPPWADLSAGLPHTEGSEPSPGPTFDVPEQATPGDPSREPPEEPDVPSLSLPEEPDPPTP